MFLLLSSSMLSMMFIFIRNNIMQSRPMDKYCSFFIQVRLLAGHEYLPALRKFLRDMNLLAMHNFQRRIKSSCDVQILTRHEFFSSCINFDEAWNLLVVHNYWLARHDFRDAWFRDAWIPARHKFFSRCINFDEAWNLLVMHDYWLAMHDSAMHEFQRGINSSRDV